MILRADNRVRENKVLTNVKPVVMTLTLALAGCQISLLAPEPAPSLQIETDQTIIADIILAQQAAWNDGDIDGYMKAYWQSPQLRFASRGTVVHGWQPTRDRYHARYSSRALMGRLTLSDLDITIYPADGAAIAHGTWALTRDHDRPSGLFTLVLHKIDGTWKIISDTTTSAD